MGIDEKVVKNRTIVEKAKNMSKMKVTEESTKVSETQKKMLETQAKVEEARKAKIQERIGRRENPRGRGEIGQKTQQRAVEQGHFARARVGPTQREARESRDEKSREEE